MQYYLDAVSDTFFCAADTNIMSALQTENWNSKKKKKNKSTNINQSLLMIGGTLGRNSRKAAE